MPDDNQTVLDPAPPKEETPPQRGDLTKALRSEREAKKALSAKLAQAEAELNALKAQQKPKEPTPTTPSFKTHEELGYDPDKQADFAQSIVEQAVQKAVSQTEAKLTLQNEMAKYEVFQSNDPYIRAARQEALRDKLEQGLDMTDAVAEAAKEIESRFVIVSKKPAPASKDTQPAPPPPGSPVAASVIGTLPEFKPDTSKPPEERASAAKGFLRNFMDRLKVE
jgi:phosphoenolpyruvate-protein kinase (PTS system EI component)